MDNSVGIYDAHASSDEVFEEYRLVLQPEMKSSPYDAIILAIGHDHFNKLDWAKYARRPQSFLM